MAKIGEETINPDYIKSCGTQAVLKFHGLSCAEIPGWNFGNTITRKVSAGSRAVVEIWGVSLPTYYSPLPTQG